MKYRWIIVGRRGSFQFDGGYFETSVPGPETKEALETAQYRLFNEVDMAADPFSCLFFRVKPGGWSFESTVMSQTGHERNRWETFVEVDYEAETATMERIQFPAPPSESL